MKRNELRQGSQILAYILLLTKSDISNRKSDYSKN